MNTAQLRILLARAVSAWIERQQMPRGLKRFAAKRTEDAALDELVEGLTSVGEHLPHGDVWIRAYRVAILHVQGYSTQRAMEKLITAFNQTLETVKIPKVRRRR